MKHATTRALLPDIASALLADARFLGSHRLGVCHCTDTIQGPVSASYRYSIGAVDVAGNEAKSSEITVPAAR